MDGHGPRHHRLERAIQALKRDGYHLAVSLETHWRGAAHPRNRPAELGWHEKNSYKRPEHLGQESEKLTENSRRDFIKQGALGTAAMLAYPTSRVLGANDRVRVGMIGVGGPRTGVAQASAARAQRSAGPRSPT